MTLGRTSRDSRSEGNSHYCPACVDMSIHIHNVPTCTPHQRVLPTVPEDIRCDSFVNYTANEPGSLSERWFHEYIAKTLHVFHLGTKNEVSPSGIVMRVLRNDHSLSAHKHGTPGLLTSLGKPRDSGLGYCERRTRISHDGGPCDL